MRVPTAEISGRLENSLGVPVARIDRNRHAYMTSSLIEDVEVSLADGRRLGMILKDLRAVSRGPESRWVKPTFLDDPAREAGMYSDVLSRLGLGTAECYAAGDDWLLLERIHGRDLRQIGDVDTWVTTARWIRRFHDSAAELVEDIRATNRPPLVLHDFRFWWRWMRRATQFHPEVDWLEDRYQSVLDEFCSLPTSLVHGEFYPLNIMVEGSESDRICPVDWETAGIGPSMLDLAALIEGTWSEGDRNRIVTGYLGSEPPSAEFERALGLCQLQVCVQWLGWAEGWNREQQPDRVFTITRIVERLDL